MRLGRCLCSLRGRTGWAAVVGKSWMPTCVGMTGEGEGVSGRCFELRQQPMRRERWDTGPCRRTCGSRRPRLGARRGWSACVDHDTGMGRGALSKGPGFSWPLSSAFTPYAVSRGEGLPVLLREVAVSACLRTNRPLPPKLSREGSGSMLVIRQDPMRRELSGTFAATVVPPWPEMVGSGPTMTGVRRVTRASGHPCRPGAQA